MSRSKAWMIPLVLALGALAGGWFGPFGPVNAADNPESTVEDSLRSFTRAYALVEDNFADPLTAERSIYRGAIPGMLRTLDPHSNFVDPKEFALMQQNQRGNYFGVGMEIGADGQEVYVMRPFPGSPAIKAGLRRGDQIMAVDDRSIANVEFPHVSELLKGPRGTQVKVTIRRTGVAEPLNFLITRGEIQPGNVDAFWVRPGVAYLRIRTFESQTISREVEEHMARLGEQKVDGMVLDLRGNPGGLVSEAVAVAGRFLPRGAIVVSHRGRAEAEQVFRAKVGNQGRQYPVVILVDRYSASAAEIVTGALQDHDRAWILGENTFGKGLVQAQFPLSEGAALLLTIARYYTPSGRLIQRDYEHQSFFEYYFHHGESKNPQDVKMTDGGRTVYGGGGITPDEKYVSPSWPPFRRRLASTRLVFRFGSEYFSARDPVLPADWKPSDQAVDRFKAFLTAQKFPFTDEEFAQDRDWVVRQVRYELYNRAFGQTAAERLAAQDDAEVQKGITSMPQARALLQHLSLAQARRRAA